MFSSKAKALRKPGTAVTWVSACVFNDVPGLLSASPPTWRSGALRYLGITQQDMDVGHLQARRSQLQNAMLRYNPDLSVPRSRDDSRAFQNLYLYSVACAAAVAQAALRVMTCHAHSL